MNLVIQLKQLSLIALLLACFALRQSVRAVVPPPDGGYPGGNTAEGQYALLGLTTGTYNTAVGAYSLFRDTAANFNTGVGAATLLSNTADENTATGAGALLSNTTGAGNTASGAFALLNNTDGDHNTANGWHALLSNTTGAGNTATGAGVLLSNTTGQNNTATGFNALNSNTEGQGNTADGIGALAFNTTGQYNTAVGFSALQFNTTGNDNSAIGALSLVANTTGRRNVALGVRAGQNVITADNVICIGYNVSGENVSDSCYIGNIFNKASVGGAAVFVNANGKLGISTSSRRFKERITPMEEASEALFGLKPVTFRYKKEIDSAGTSQFGLVAEDVENVNPDLVVRDKEGKAYSVRYDQVNAMLLNEFLKEHCKVQEQGATIAQQRKDFEAAIAQQQNEIEALTATVKEQAAQIQKVTAQLEASKPAPQMVSSNQ
jgi:Chaperone of endosialidase